MKWKKQILLIGLFGIALGAFLKTLRRYHSSSTTLLDEKVQPPVASTPLSEKVQPPPTIPSASSKKLTRKRFSVLKVFTIFVARVRKASYGGPKSQDSFWAKIRQNSTVREYPFYLPVNSCAGV